MAGSEESRVEELHRNMAEGDREPEELVFDPVTQTVRSFRRGDPTGDDLRFSRPDLGYAGTSPQAGSIAVTAEQLACPCGDSECTSLEFRCLDDGDVFSSVGAVRPETAVKGTICFSPTADHPDDAAFEDADDRVRLIVRRRAEPGGSMDGAPISGVRAVRGFTRSADRWNGATVNIVPLREKLFCRTEGILETDLLAGKEVCLFGGGSIGASVGMGLIEAGVTRTSIMDDDRLSIENVARHPAGISHVGRYKTRVLADLFRDKNPYTVTRTYEQRITWETQDLVRELVRRSDLVICAVDDPVARAIINLICIQEQKTLILAGAMRRAHGGQALVVRPHRTPCYQCFQMYGPGRSTDQEVASANAAARRAYGNRPVAAEPGLSNDIAPTCQMVVKLAIQHLLSGADTTLHSLDEDLTAPWFLWLNRREPGTEFAQLKPLGCKIDGMHVMRWYGIAMKPHPSCPACGDFIGRASAEEGLPLTA